MKRLPTVLGSAGAGEYVLIDLTNPHLSGVQWLSVAVPFAREEVDGMSSLEGLAKTSERGQYFP